MTACAIETGAGGGALREAVFTIAADGSYAARLAGVGDARFPERWTLDGPEPYAVPLPADQPEEPDTGLLPLADGRVLIHRREGGASHAFAGGAGRHSFSLLYPTGPRTGRCTGELRVGAVECEHLELLPPAPGGSRAYALAVGELSTVVWLVAGGSFGPERVAEVGGRCSGGVWLDGTGRMLALDREADGVTKAVAVDLERGGEMTPLLQITDGSNDRLLLADADSGLLLLRSDAPGEDRLGWGVLGSMLPVRFPESLEPADCAVTPFAVQPGQMLTPENCAVGLRVDGAAGNSWVGVWRPSGRRLHHLAAPAGWLAGAGLFTATGVLQLPYATGEVPCGVAGVAAPEDPQVTKPARAESAGGEPFAAPDTPVVCKPVPLQQAPLNGRGAVGLALHRK
ncbi:hypothetical protein [Streptomyces hypolithicus]